jgi:hypothetical protein
MEKIKNKHWSSKLGESRAFQAVSGVAALGFAYVFASWAIDSGSLLDYAITLLLAVIGLRELALAIFKKTNGR